VQERIKDIPDLKNHLNEFILVCRPMIFTPRGIMTLGLLIQNTPQFLGLWGFRFLGSSGKIHTEKKKEG